MPIVYTIVHGKMTRKNHEGDYVDLGPGDKFVPSPSELAAEKYRLRPVGTVNWDSKEAKAAIQNTNKKDFPSFGKDDDDDMFVPEPEIAEDIREVKDAKTAVEIIGTVTSEDVLDKYFSQEADNQPRVRKSVLKAIEDRRAALKPAPTAESLLGSARSGKAD